MKIAMVSVCLLLLVAVLLVVPIGSAESTSSVSEAPAGFDGQTNGFTTQAQFDLDRQTFAEQESISEGLGPLFNAQSCENCHQNPITGGISQVTELRAGHFNGFRFIEQSGGSLI